MLVVMQHTLSRDEQGVSQDEKTASPHNILGHKNNVVDEFQSLKKTTQLTNFGFEKNNVDAPFLYDWLL